MQEKTSQNRLAMYGIHPLVAVVVVAVDAMLFAEEIVSLGAGWIISILVAIVLVIGSTLIQKKAFGDEWGLAIGKGILLGVLTAIPTPIPSSITLTSGVVGTLKIIQDRKQSKQTV